MTYCFRFLVFFFFNPRNQNVLFGVEIDGNSTIRMFFYSISWISQKKLGKILNLKLFLSPRSNFGLQKFVPYDF